MRFKAVSCMARSYRPTLPVSYIAQFLGFTSVVPENDGTDEKDSDGLEECIEWLKAHGACLIADNNGEMQLDAKVRLNPTLAFSLAGAPSYLYTPTEYSYVSYIYVIMISTQYVICDPFGGKQKFYNEKTKG